MVFFFIYFGMIVLSLNNEMFTCIYFVNEAVLLFDFLSQGQPYIPATLVQQVPSIQEQRLVSNGGKLCR